MNLFISFLIIMVSFCNFKKSQTQIVSDSEKKEPEMLLLKLTWFEGDVSILRNKAKIPLVPDLELEKEDSIITGPTGSAELLFGIDESIKVGNNSELSITNLLTVEGNAVSSLSMKSGRVLTILFKEKKENQVILVSPNAVAKINGSVLLTQVLHKDPKQKNTSCDINSCITKLIALDGSIPIKQTGSNSDIVLERNLHVFVSKEKELAQNMTLPLDKNSLSEVTSMLVFHGDEHLVDSKLLDEYKTKPVSEVKTKSVVVPAKKRKIVPQIKSKEKKIYKKKINFQKTIKPKKNLSKDFHKDKLKLDPNKRF